MTNVQADKACLNYSIDDTKRTNWDNHSWPSLEPAPKPKSKCNTVIVLQAVDDPAYQRYQRVMCNSWECKVCRPELEAKWLDGLKGYLAEAEAIYLDTIDASAWASYRRSLSREGGKYIKVALPNNKLAIINTVKGGLVDPSMREGLLSAALGAAVGRRPISSSRAWALPNEPKGEAKWVKLQRLPYNIDFALGVAEHSGRGLVIPWQQGFDVILPSRVEAEALSYEMAIALVPSADRRQRERVFGWLV